MISIVIPVLGRPEAVRAVLASIAASTTVKHHVLMMCSPSDEEGLAAVEATGVDHRVVMWHPGKADFAMKTNVGFRITSDPFVFLGATDLRFLPGWDHAVIEVAEATGAGVIGTDDMGNPLVKRGRHATHPVVRRSYIEELGGTFDEEPGVVYAECYDHQCVDNELVQVAQDRGQWAFARGAQVEHLHFLWKKSERDEVYDKAMARGQHDIRLFGQRRADWTRRQRRTRVGA